MTSTLYRAVRVALALACLCGIAQAHAGTYSIAERWTLGAGARIDGGAFDPVRRRVFVTHGDRVDVLDAKSGEVVGEIGNTHGAHEILLAEDLKVGFVSAGASNSVTVFDIETLKVNVEIRLPGRDPGTLVYEQNKSLLYVFNGASRSVNVIDVKTLKVVNDFKIGGTPRAAQSNGRSWIYYNSDAGEAALEVLDMDTSKVVRHWKLVGCEHPAGLAIDDANNRLFAACSNKVLIVVDGDTGRLVAHLPIGAAGGATIFDAGTRLLFTADGDGTLSIARQDAADHYSHFEMLATAQGARALAFDGDAKRLYLPANVAGKFTVLVAAPN